MSTVPSPEQQSPEQKALDILLRSGTRPPKEMLDLAVELAGRKSFDLARRILKRARAGLSRSEAPDVYQEIFQKSALFTYKDESLPLAWKLDQALGVLGEAEDLAATENQETLGLAGAIYKRKWQMDGLRQNLERSLFYYLRGYAVGLRDEHVDSAVPAADRRARLQALRADIFQFLRDHPQTILWADEDRGYCGINAAFVLDLLAHEENAEARRAGLTSIAAHERRAAAQLIREEISRSVPRLLSDPEKRERLARRGKDPAQDWWFFATLGEAAFGLGRYDQALSWLSAKPREAGLDVSEWKYESTARQLAHLALTQAGEASSEQDFEATEAGQALKRFLGGDEKAVRSAFRGKFGLGLSGGGFRASIFHIGVLARLAELDLLRHLEAISCVSGGSIIGAHYYLELRHLLQTKTDGEITRQDYIDIVQRIESDFLTGVQRNLRTRVLAEWTTNLKMIFSSGYTRTQRLGELYERELFARVQDGEGGEKRFLNRLLIHPKGKDGKLQTAFSPRNHNWRRRNKVPVLILNATSLNTGHGWQFTASYMGEPPTPINRDIDSNERLRRLYYHEAPETYRDFRLGYAVAASSCVPGLFEPLILDGLYPDGDDQNPISVRLVDGGACDNQGVASLLEQDCTVMLVSDASGQMEAQDVPAGGAVGVLLRTSSVSQARVREAQYTDIAERRRAFLLRGLMFIHLRQDLPGDNVAWKGCDSSRRVSDFASPEAAGDATSYGVATGIQRRLSAVRTDLDSFHDAESFALMASAYRMTAEQIENRRSIAGFDPPQDQVRWKFLDIEAAMKPGPPSEKPRKHLERLLDESAKLAFKVWSLSQPLKILKWLLLALVGLGVVWLFATHWDDSLLPKAISSWTFGHLALIALSFVGFAVLAAAINGVVGKKLGANLMRVIRWRDTLKTVARGVGMSTVGFLLARLHLHVFDPLYLRCGKLDKFPK